MNRRIFSLVCIALYALLDASIYCSQQKEFDARNKSVRGTKEINRSNDEYDKESSGFNLFKKGKKSKRSKESIRTKEDVYGKLPSDLSSDEKIKIFLNNVNGRPIDKAEFIKFILVNGLEQSINSSQLDEFIIKHSINKPNGRCWFSN
ncbi:fam-c protein [Plasmodium vinckei brucechwatti]|uniref:Fam-c protein n=1 Tax=Plasmodium vinckei brucechwatti TaxID=119398 RepID=A0A6V7S9D9_PLAVN|nr:fam-c protein [Plasmodium vinckei brucechwatti]